ncbi:phosphatidylinositol-binding protein scs2 [Balamuthia mandrillaris]
MTDPLSPSLDSMTLGESRLITEEELEGLHDNPYLQINPTMLHFPPPLNRIITNILTLRNTSTDKYIAYKVKTTRPNRYCVRPSMGMVSPGEAVELQVHYSFHKDPPKSLRCKDKFLVESIVLKPEVGSSPEEVSLSEWFKRASPTEIMKQKLKCHFSSTTVRKLPSSSASYSSTTTTTPTTGNKASTSPSMESSTIIPEEKPQTAELQSRCTNPTCQLQHKKLALQLRDCQKERDGLQTQVRSLLNRIEKLEDQGIGLRQRTTGGQPSTGKAAPTTITSTKRPGRFTALTQMPPRLVILLFILVAVLSFGLGLLF